MLPTDRTYNTYKVGTRRRPSRMQRLFSASDYSARPASSHLRERGYRGDVSCWRFWELTITLLSA